MTKFLKGWFTRNPKTKIFITFMPGRDLTSEEPYIAFLNKDDAISFARKTNNSPDQDYAWVQEVALVGAISNTNIVYLGCSLKDRFGNICKDEIILAGLKPSDVQKAIIGKGWNGHDGEIVSCNLYESEERALSGMSL